MTEPKPTGPPSHVDMLAHQLDAHDGIADMHDLFLDALLALERLEDINIALSCSERPDLKIEKRVDVLPLDNLEDTHFKTLNNFIPHLIATATRAGGTFQSHEDFFDEWGAKGSPDDYVAMATEKGNMTEVAEILMYTQMLKPAPTRMWILFPELTQMVFGGLRNRDTSDLSSNNDVAAVREEVFVAYNIMARLIDESDPGVLQPDENGEQTVDTHYLWH